MSERLSTCSNGDSGGLFLPYPAFVERGGLVVTDPEMGVQEASLLVNNGSMPSGGGIVHTPSGHFGGFDYVHLDESGTSTLCLPLPKSHVGEHDDDPDRRKKVVTEPGGAVVFSSQEGYAKVLADVQLHSGFRRIPSRHNRTVGRTALLPSGLIAIFRYPMAPRLDISDVDSGTGAVTLANSRRLF